MQTSYWKILSNLNTQIYNLYKIQYLPNNVQSVTRLMYNTNLQGINKMLHTITKLSKSFKKF